MIMKECINITQYSTHSLFTLCGGWMQCSQSVNRHVQHSFNKGKWRVGNDSICDSWAAGTIKVNRLIVMGLEQPCLACGRAVNLFCTMTAPNLNGKLSGIECDMGLNLNLYHAQCNTVLCNGLKARINRDSTIPLQCGILCRLKVVLNNSCIKR